ncbi:MAG TPA: hypothetical protein VEW93_08715 [Acidimicrobiales bacterium]|nr:hypothetical protein [Acidimicrobiales bacterium]
MSSSIHAPTAIPAAFPVEVTTSPMACWSAPDTDLGRQLAEAEAEAFPEAPQLFAGDASSILMGMAFGGLVRHLMRLSVPAIAPGVAMPLILDDLARSGQGLTHQQLLDHYGARGIALDRVVSVETNVRVGEREADIPSADMSYLSVFDLMRRIGSGAVFAHLNDAARSSFARVGLQDEPIAGVEGLRTPGVHPGEFDDHYTPVCLPVTEGNVAVIEALSPAMAASRWSPEPPPWW